MAVVEGARKPREPGDEAQERDRTPHQGKRDPSPSRQEGPGKVELHPAFRLTGIPKGTLAFWAHKLRKAGKAAAPSSPKDGAPSPFVEVLVPPREASLQCPAIELVLPQGLLRIPPGFHGPSLKALLHILQEEEC